MSINSKKNNVYVGLSGGVDSSVSASLLKDKGFDVTGVFIKIWHPELSNCDWKSEMRDAMRVCATLNIPFKMIDLSEEYYKEVIQYLIDEYKVGNTPNPDVMCNKIIKFGHFYNWAIKDGANFVATGHYAQIDNNRKLLLKASDIKKDQTYFLWNIKRDNLKNIIFPVGRYKKEKVRQLAKKFNLPTAQKKDSQGLCFIGHVDLKSFLKKHLNTKKGDVLDEKGNVIGVHDGSEIYTIGERHGFEINNKVDNQNKHYVVSKDLNKNTITVSKNFNQEKIKIKSLNLKQINILSDNFSENDVLDILIRYNGSFLKANLKKNQIVFEKSEEPVAKGQSIVFYKGDVCIGGGIVD